MEGPELRSMLLSALNSVSRVRHQELDLNATVDEMGLDSLGLTQIILYIEDKLGGEMEPEVLDRLASVKTIGAFYEVLSSAMIPV